MIVTKFLIKSNSITPGTRHLKYVLKNYFVEKRISQLIIKLNHLLVVLLLLAILLSGVGVLVVKHYTGKLLVVKHN
jgi:cell division protein FtsL